MLLFEVETNFNQYNQKRLDGELVNSLRNFALITKHLWRAANCDVIEDCFVH